MDPENAQAACEWPAPESHKQVQHFLGFANFYRRLICNFSPIADLTEKQILLDSPG